MTVPHHHPAIHENPHCYYQQCYVGRAVVVLVDEPGGSVVHSDVAPSIYTEDALKPTVSRQTDRQGKEPTHKRIQLPRIRLRPRRQPPDARRVILPDIPALGGRVPAGNRARARVVVGHGTRVPRRAVAIVRAREAELGARRRVPARDRRERLAVVHLHRGHARVERPAGDLGVAEGAGVARDVQVEDDPEVWGRRVARVALALVEVGFVDVDFMERAFVDEVAGLAQRGAGGAEVGNGLLGVGDVAEPLGHDGLRVVGRGPRPCPRAVEGVAEGGQVGGLGEEAIVRQLAVEVRVQVGAGSGRGHPDDQDLHERREHALLVRRAVPPFKGRAVLCVLVGRAARVGQPLAQVVVELIRRLVLVGVGARGRRGGGRRRRAVAAVGLVAKVAAVRLAGLVAPHEHLDALLCDADGSRGACVGAVLRVGEADLVPGPGTVGEGVRDGALAAVVVVLAPRARGAPAPALARAHHELVVPGRAGVVGLALGRPRAVRPGLGRVGDGAAGRLVSRVAAAGNRAHLGLAVVAAPLAFAAVVEAPPATGRQVLRGWAAQGLRLAAPGQAFGRVQHELARLVLARDLLEPGGAGVAAVDEPADAVLRGGRGGGAGFVAGERQSQPRRAVDVDRVPQRGREPVGEGVHLVVLADGPDQHASQAHRLGVVGFELPGLFVVVRDPLVGVPGDDLDGRLLVQRPIDAVLLHDLLDFAVEQDARRVAAGARRARGEILTARLRARAARQGVAAAVEGQAKVDLGRGDIHTPEQVQRGLDLGQVRVSIQVGPGPLVSDIPSPMQVVRHEIKPVNRGLNRLEVKVLQVPVAGGESDGQPVAVLAQRALQARQEGREVVIVLCTAVAVIRSWILPVDVHPVEQANKKHVLLIGISSRQVGEGRRGALDAVREVPPSNRYPQFLLRIAILQCRQLLVECFITLRCGDDLEGVRVDAPKGKVDVGVHALGHRVGRHAIAAARGSRRVVVPNHAGDGLGAGITRGHGDSLVAAELLGCAAEAIRAAADVERAGRGIDILGRPAAGVAFGFGVAVVDAHVGAAVVRPHAADAILATAADLAGHGGAAGCVCCYPRYPDAQAGEQLLGVDKESVALTRPIQALTDEGVGYKWKLSQYPHGQEVHNTRAMCSTPYDMILIRARLEYIIHGNSRYDTSQAIQNAANRLTASEKA
ncbi:uncharacterized protein DSM5745_01779 [Aspergillus mulundensis]|uniref:Uncharacterized protein n=1 Tax=Aspergillus mulundensis TaxID=1810919 RepID=A0A3D8SUR1_9EURO|nr:hypothetical protein DSM5745_01779 [Aspergillus mulundensis]RDW90004.1 hypothetical protein DSM5745_01779 [Aspergillus mulundensis]